MQKVHKVDITQLRISKPFIKFVARNLNSPDYKKLQKLKELYENSKEQPLKTGDRVIIRTNARRFERGHFIQKQGDKAYVFVNDCACNGVFELNQLRLLEDPELLALKNQGYEFIIARIMTSLENDSRDGCIKLHTLLMGNTFDMAVIEKDDTGIYVDLRLGDASLTEDLIPSDELLNKTFETIDLELQKSMMLRKLQEEPIKGMETYFEENKKKPEINPPPANSKPVVVSAYHDGVKSFYIRLKEKRDEIRKFVLKVNEIRDDLVPLRLILNDEAIGKPCIALYNTRLYRSNVVQVKGNLPNNYVVVQLMETGERLTMNADKLFKLPDNFSAVPPYSKQYQLERVNPQFALSEEQVNFMFHFLTKDKTLQMVDLNESGDIPTCKLYLDGQNIAEKIRKWDPFLMEYPTQPKLPRNVEMGVKVTFGNSPENFFVALTSKTEEMDKKLDELKHMKVPCLREINVNSACLVKFENQLHRGKIVDKCVSNIYNVQFVDYGKDDEFASNELLTIVEELVKVPPQAYKCVLKGYEDQLVCVDVMDSFEKVLDQYDSSEFRMIVVGMERDSYVVKLFDPSGKNVYETLEESRKIEETKGDWSEPVTPMSLHFANCAMRNTNETVHAKTLTESSRLDDKTLIPDGSPSGSSSVIETSVENRRTSIPPSSKPSENTSVSSSGVSSVKDAERPSLEPGKLTLVTSISDFSIQRLEDVPKYENYISRIQTAAGDQPMFESLENGAECLAYNSFSNKWCRAVIVDFEPRDYFVSLRCVDDGECFCVTDRKELKEISSDLKKEPVYCRQYSLAFSAHPKREGQAYQTLLRLMYEKIEFREIASFNNVNYVEVYADGKNVAHEFAKNGLGKVIHCLRNDEPVFVTYVDSIDKFVIQTQANVEALEHIRQKLSDYEHKAVERPQVGMFVVARGSPRQEWLRGRITSIDHQHFTVHLLDFGFEKKVNEIGAVDKNLAAIPEVAVLCSLVLPERIKTVEKVENDSFKNLANKGKTRFTVQMVEPGEEKVRVKLFVDGVDVVEKLFPEECLEFSEEDFERLFN